MGSGKHLDADVVFTATGFNLFCNSPFPSEMKVDIDGIEYKAVDHFFFNSCHVTDVPNMIFTFGYFKYSWTIASELRAEYGACLLRYMRQNGFARFSVSAEGVSVAPEDALMSGYVQRSAQGRPKTGFGRFSVAQNPFIDMWRLKYSKWPNELQFE